MNKIVSNGIKRCGSRSRKNKYWDWAGEGQALIYLRNDSKARKISFHFPIKTIIIFRNRISSIWFLIQMYADQKGWKGIIWSWRFFILCKPKLHYILIASVSFFLSFIFIFIPWYLFHALSQPNDINAANDFGKLEQRGSEPEAEMGLYLRRSLLP